MWLLLLPIGAVAAVLAATAYTKKKESAPASAAAAAAQGAGLAQMNYFTDGVLRLATNNVQYMPQPAERQQLAALATGYGLPKTAQALISGGAWPNDEIWPGTSESVASHIGKLWQTSQWNPQRVA
jgi:hypothetical protein